MKIKQPRKKFHINLSSARTGERLYFGVLFLLIFLLSASVFPYTGYTDAEKVRTVPDVLLALSVVSGILSDDRKFIAGLALAFGALSDFFLTPPAHLSPILFFLAAYFSSVTVNAFTSVNPVTATAASLPFLLARSVTGGVALLSASGGKSFGYVVKKILLPELAVNVITVFAVYLIIGFLYKKILHKGSTKY